MKATAILHSVFIPQFCENMIHNKGTISYLLHSHFVGDIHVNDDNIIYLCHSEGINARHLGLVRSYLIGYQKQCDDENISQRIDYLKYVLCDLILAHFAGS
jgi:hypothetical protein